MRTPSEPNPAATPIDAARKSAADTAACRRRRRWLIVVLALVGIGAGLRLVQYASRPSYWHDEAALALNVFERPARALVTGPLDAVPRQPQAAPPLFLLAERGAFLAFGRSELGMRLVPLVLGLVGLGLFARLAWRELPSPAAAALAVALFACSDRLIWHATEVKQYVGDVLVSILLLLVALPRPGGPGATTRLGRASIVAAAGAWVSHPVAFVFGGISLALLPAVVRERRRGWLTYLACNALAAASFLAVYAVSIRPQQAAALYDYWARRFVPWDAPWTVPVWLARALVSLCNYPLELAGPVLLVLAGLGAWALARDEQRERLAVLVAPVGLVLAAAALHRYPFGGSRLTLFLAPVVFLLAAGGMLVVHRALHQRVWVFWSTPAVFLLGVAVYHAAQYATDGDARTNIRPAVAHVAAHARPGDAIYTTKLAEFLCYWPTGRPQVVRPADAIVPADPGAPARCPAARRFWLVMSFEPGRYKRVVKPVASRLEAVADQRESFSVPGGAALLFTTTGPTAAAPRGAAPGARVQPGAAPAGG